MSCHSLLQEIFLTQGLNPDLPHFRQILYHLSHQGSPIYMCVCVYVYIYIYIYNFQRSRIGHIYIYTHTYICIYICIWLYTHIYTYICDYIHTHTHIWVLSGSLCNSSVKHKTIHINSSSRVDILYHIDLIIKTKILTLGQYHLGQNSPTDLDLISPVFLQMSFFQILYCI